MKGMGTNDNQLIRLIVTRSEIDMQEIKQAFVRNHGETLESCISVSFILLILLAKIFQY